MNSMCTYDVFMDKIDNVFTGDLCHRCCLNPFGEIINGYNCKLTAIGCFLQHWSNYINSHIEKDEGEGKLCILLVVY